MSDDREPPFGANIPMWLVLSAAFVIYALCIYGLHRTLADMDRLMGLR